MSDELAARREAEEEQARIEEAKARKEQDKPPQPEVPHDEAVSQFAQELSDIIIRKSTTIGDAMVIANMVRDNVQFHAVSSLVYAELSKGVRKLGGKTSGFGGGGGGWPRRK